MSLPLTLGERIAILREGREMTQEDLAAATGLSRAQISLIETNRIAGPRQSTLRKLAAALGLPDELELIELVTRGFSEKVRMLARQAQPRPSSVLPSGSSTIAEAENVLLREQLIEVKQDKQRLICENEALREELKKSGGNPDQPGAEHPTRPIVPPFGPLPLMLRPKGRPKVRF